jgi:shikimate kinase
MWLSRKPRAIFLIGFMGAGKTTVGRILAREIGAGFVDLDEVIERECGVSISEIFARFGEDYFRDLETRSLGSVDTDKVMVIATGGGVVLREGNWSIMRQRGVTVYLRASPEVLYMRVRDSSFRPLLNVKNPKERLFELLSQRASLYERADLIIDTDSISPYDVAEEIIRRLSLRG